MADLNELIKSAKNKAAKQAGQASGSSGNGTASRSAFNGSGATQAPQEARPAPTHNPGNESVIEKAVVPDPHPESNEPGGSREKFPKTSRQETSQPANSPAEETDLQTSKLSRKESKQRSQSKAREEKLRKMPPQVKELLKQYREYIEKDKEGEFIQLWIETDSRNLLSLFCKAYGFRVQDLASFIIKQYLDDNFADFVKKARNAGF